MNIFGRNIEKRSAVMGVLGVIGLLIYLIFLFKEIFAEEHLPPPILE